MRTTETIDKLEFGQSTKKNVNKLNQLIEQVNNNTEHIILADDKTIRKITVDGEDRLATNMEVLTLDQFQTLLNGQKVTLADGREIEFDDNCLYYITDDNGDAVINNLYKRIDYGMIRGWANDMVCDETIDPIPTLKYLYAYAPVDGPVNGHPMYTCRITKLSNEFIEVEATDLYTGYNYVTVKRNGTWSDWISSTPEFMCASSDVVLYVSQNGDDLNGAGTKDSPYKTFAKAISAFPPIENGHNYIIRALSGAYPGFDLSGVGISIAGYEQDVPAIITFTSQITLANGASLIADSKNMLSINFRIPTNGIAIIADLHSEVFVNCNAVFSGEVDAVNTTGVDIRNGSSCTLYSSVYASNITTVMTASAVSSIFADAITASSCDCVGTADRGAIIAYESIKCNEVKTEFTGIHGGRIIRGNQVERCTVIGNNTGVISSSNGDMYKVAELEVANGSREIKTTFSVRSTYKSSSKYGILTLDFATNSDMSAIEYCDGYWEYASTELPVQDFKVVYRLLNHKLTATLYLTIRDAWQTYAVDVIGDARRSQPYPYDNEQWRLPQSYLASDPINITIDGEVDRVMIPHIEGHQFTDTHSQKLEALILYEKTFSFIIDDNNQWKTDSDTGDRPVARGYIRDSRITSADSVSVTVSDDALASITKHNEISGETYDGGFMITVVSTDNTLALPIVFEGTYKIRKAVLDN